MQNITFITSLPTFYLKGNLSMDEVMLNLKKPNTIAGFIPLGYKSDQVPVQQISTASTEFKVNGMGMLVGILSTIVGLILFYDIKDVGFLLFIWALLCLALGVVVIIDSLQTTLTVTATSGVAYVVPFLIFERSKAEEAKKMVLEIVISRTNMAQNAPQQFAQPVQAVPGATYNTYQGTNGQQ